MSRKKKSKSTVPQKTFLDCYDEILSIINSRRFKWQLTAVPSISWEDVVQILLRHIYIKFDLYDQSRSLKSWVMVVANNQILNLLRNNYGNFQKPCIRCPEHEGEDLCKKFGVCSTKCDLLKLWVYGKKSKHDIQLPLSIENKINECHDIAHEQLDIDRSANNIHHRMKEILKPLEWLIYKMLYVDKLEESVVCQKLKYKTNESGRNPGYARISQIKKCILQKVKQELNNGNIEIITN